MAADNSVLGYGSLILPTSVVARFREVGDIGRIYQSETGYSRNELLREEALEEWEQLSSRMDIIPVKVYGFKRRYSLDSKRGQAMVEAVYNGEEDDWMNAVLISGLKEEELEGIRSTESNYEPVGISADEIKSYLDPETMESEDLEIPERLEIFAPREDSENTGFETDRSKNHVYHNRILKGIEMLGEIYGRELEREFKWDYLWTTEERSHEGIEDYEPVWMVNMLNKT